MSFYRYGFGAYFNILPGSEWSALMLTYGFPLAIIGMALKVVFCLPIYIRHLTQVYCHVLMRNTQYVWRVSTPNLQYLYLYIVVQYAELKPVPCLTYSDALALREKCATPILLQVVVILTLLLSRLYESRTLMTFCLFTVVFIFHYICLLLSYVCFFFFLIEFDVYKLQHFLFLMLLLLTTKLWLCTMMWLWIYKGLTFVGR